MQIIIINMDILNKNNKIYGVNEKGEIKRKGIKERNEIERKKNWRILMKLGHKMCMPLCCDDCVYVNILTCLV